MKQILRPDGFVSNASVNMTVTPVGAVNTPACINESAPDNDTTYILHTQDPPVANSIGLAFSTGSPRFQRGAITDVRVTTRHRNAVGGAVTSVVSQVRIGTTYYTGTSVSGSTSTASFYTNKVHSFTTNPATGLAWSWADMVALQIGYGAIPANGALWRVTQLYAEVYSDPPGWKGDAAFTFPEDADAALIDYLEDTDILDSNVNGLHTLLSAVTFRHDPRDNREGDGPTSFPLCHVWTPTLIGPYWEAGDNTCAPVTRITLWTQNANPKTALESCRAYLGAIMSSIMQIHTLEVQAYEAEPAWLFYATTLLDVRLDSITIENGLAKGVVTVNWRHVE